VDRGLRTADWPKKKMDDQQRGQNPEYRSANNIRQIMRRKVESRKSDQDYDWQARQTYSPAYKE
jgi:hypothetical protein